MSELLVIGSTAFDTIITPTDRRDYIIGGSASHGVYAASFFTKTRLCGVVGHDWTPEHTKLFTDRGVDVTDLEIRPDGKTFFWKGEYSQDMNVRTTLETQLNVLGDFSPNLSPGARQAPYLFLANGSPVTQMQAISQCSDLKFVVADTMGFYIMSQRPQLLELMGMIDGLVLNDEEAEMLTEKKDVLEAADRLCEMGPRFVIIKKGSHGSLYFSKDAIISLPAYPTRKLVEPTGAGDCFAGAMMGYIAGQNATDLQTIKTAIAYGTVAASFVVEDFSFDALKSRTRQDIDARMEEFREMLRF